MTHGVNALEEDVTQNVKGHASARLNASIGHAVARVGETQVLFLHGELLAADGKAHHRKLADVGVGRENVSLLRGVVFAAWDRLVNGCAGGVVDESEGRSGISDGGVAGTIDRLAGDNGRGAVEHPEALGIVHGRVVWGLAAKGSLVDVAKGVEGFAFVWIIRVLDGAKIGGEELRSLWDVLLGDHVLDRSLYRVGSNSIDGTPGETEETIATVLLKLGREGFGQFDGLVFDDETAYIDDVCSHGARGRGVIAVRYLPRRTRRVLERA